MAKILIVGIDPAAVDFSDPALPGLTPEGILQGIARGLAAMAAAGHDPRHILIPAAIEGAIDALADPLSSERFECLVIGGGVHLPPANRALFEALLNLVATIPQPPAIALVARPDEMTIAAERALATRAAMPRGRPLFRRRAMAGAVFDDVNLADSRFTDINLRGSRFDDVNLSEVSIENANIDGLTIFGHDIQALIRAAIAGREG